MGSVAEINREATRRVIEEAFNRRNLDVIDDIIAADCIDHQQWPGASLTAREQLKAIIRDTDAGLPDFHVSIEQLLADGEYVVLRSILTGTQTGTFMGIPACNERVSVEIMDLMRFRDGVCVEHWGIIDSLALMQQLHAQPSAV